MNLFSNDTVMGKLVNVFLVFQFPINQPILYTKTKANNDNSMTLIFFLNCAFAFQDSFIT